ncbi:hypothetical protein WJX79_000188 [Trebouxia sp. C0005]
MEMHRAGVSLLQFVDDTLSCQQHYVRLRYMPPTNHMQPPKTRTQLQVPDSKPLTPGFTGDVLKAASLCGV